MQTLLSVLGMLACPLGMGLMAWVLVRPSSAHEAPHCQPEGATRPSLWSFIACCLNWKVISGLAALGLGLWVVTPQRAGAIVPVLLMAICPLSMLVLAWQARRATQGPHAQRSAHGVPAAAGAGEAWAEQPCESPRQGQEVSRP